MRPKRLAWAGAAILAGVAFLAGGKAGLPPAGGAWPGVEERIFYYQRAVEEDPGNWPSLALLGRAWLDRARATRSPQDLQESRRHLQRSLEVQPNLEAFRTMAAASNYAHRFEDAIRWCRKSASAAPDDSAVTALEVEALLGLGRRAEAEALLPGGPAEGADFHFTVARAHTLLAANRQAQAAETFVRAADLARDQDAFEHAAWAEIQAAAVHLHGNRPDSARPHLDTATRYDRRSRLLRAQEAEWLAAEGRAEEALDLLEETLLEYPDPATHAAAFALARLLGLQQRAAVHFSAAEQGFQKAIDAGEIYTLGALARLYYAAGVKLEQGRELAEENLRFKRDTEAVATLAAFPGATPAVRQF